MLILAFFIITFSFLNAQHYEIQANQWKNEYLSNLNHSELQIVANLIYWSYHHSKSNIDSQNCSEQCFESMWQCWQNVSQRRLNTANENFTATNPKLFLNTAKKFSDVVERHKKISINYSKMVDEIFKSSNLSDNAKQACSHMREQARHEIAKSMCGQFSNELINFLKKIKCKKKLAAFIFYKLFSSKKAYFSIPFLSSWGAEQFSNIYKDYNDASIVCWDAFFKTQQAGNFIWNTIEKTRKEFYSSHYNVAIEILKKQKADKKYFKILFLTDSALPEKLSD
ncbi:hypothetical protein M1446_02865 [Candidatus Dependentiae bacterium]|nr:hypothetical protein [Candidatus Dependentiae bacterium]